MECKEYKQKCKLTNFFYFGFELLIILYNHFPLDLTHFLEKICYSCSQWKNYPLDSANQLTNQPRNQFIHTLLAFRLIYLKLPFSHSNARRRFSSEAVKRSNAMPLDFVCVLLVICIKITHTTRCTPNHSQQRSLKFVVQWFQG